MTHMTNSFNNPRPLEGIRVLAFEQVQAVPLATLLLARLGAEVVKVEPPVGGETGRASVPFVLDRTGARAGATFLRYSAGKKSLAIDYRQSAGQEVLHEIIPQFDIICENLGPGRAAKFNVGYDQVSKIAPAVVYMSISGFGADGKSPYNKWPAFAGVAEAMSGIYEFYRQPQQPPIMNPMGAVGDTSTGLYGVIGILAALMQREKTGMGQLVDVSMFDAMVSFSDLVPNYWSMGVERDPEKPQRPPALMGGFKAKDGYFVLQAVRPHQFVRIAEVIGKPEWIEDPSLATPWDWAQQTDAVLRPAIEAWAKDKSKIEASEIMAGAGVASGPCLTAPELAADPHVIARSMLVEAPMQPAPPQPVLIAGNPIKMTNVPDLPDGEYPVLGEHTFSLLRQMGLSQARLEQLKLQKVINNYGNYDSAPSGNTSS